eukprot:6948551-Alexandrium_andersonii.AAC.1
MTHSCRRGYTAMAAVICMRWARGSVASWPHDRRLWPRMRRGENVPTMCQSFKSNKQMVCVWQPGTSK